MPTRKPGATLRAQWLGQQLRALRESAGMTLKQAGGYLQRDPSMVSRFESAVHPIRRGDVLALIDLYGVSDERTRDGMLRLSEDVWRKDWWDGYANAVDRQYIDLPWLGTAVMLALAVIFPLLLRSVDPDLQARAKSMYVVSLAWECCVGFCLFFTLVAGDFKWPEAPGLYSRAVPQSGGWMLFAASAIVADTLRRTGRRFGQPWATQAPTWLFQPRNTACKDRRR